MLGSLIAVVVDRPSVMELLILAVEIIFGSAIVYFSYRLANYYEEQELEALVPPQQPTSPSTSPDLPVVAAKSSQTIQNNVQQQAPPSQSPPQQPISKHQSSKAGLAPTSITGTKEAH